MASSVKSVDKGAKKTLAIYAKLAKKTYLEVGIPNDGKRHVNSPMTVFDIGMMHEFGLGVPERSFIRAYYDQNKVRVQTLIKRVTELVAQGKITQEQGMNQLGLRLASEMQQRIAMNIPPPLAPETIARKGSDIALIDTGQLRSAITYILHLARGGS